MGTVNLDKWWQKNWDKFELRRAKWGAMLKKLELELNAARLGVGDDVANMLVAVRGWNRD